MREVNEKLDKINDRLSSIDKTLAAQHVVLEQHIARTKALEEQVDPVVSRMTELKGAINFVKFIGIIAAIAEAISQCFHWKFK